MPYAVCDQAVKVCVEAKAVAEALDMCCGADLSVGDTPLPRSITHPRAETAGEGLVDFAQELAVPGDLEAKPIRECEYDLAHWDAWDDFVDEVGRRVDHPATVAAWAEAADLAAERDQHVVTAVAAADAGESVGEDAAADVLLEGALDELWRFGALGPGAGQEGVVVGVHRLPQSRVSRLSATIGELSDPSLNLR